MFELFTLTILLNPALLPAAFPEKLKARTSNRVETRVALGLDVGGAKTPSRNPPGALKSW